MSDNKEIYRCPNCGATFKSFQSECSFCGCEFKNVTASDSLSKFASGLKKIESKPDLRRAKGLI